MGNYDSITKVSFWQLGGALNGTCVAHTSLKSCFTFGPPFFRWCPSLRSPIPIFPLKALLFSLKFSLKVRKGVCSYCEGLHPLGPSFNLFKNHYDFASSSSFPCLDYLIKFQLKANLDFKKKHVQVAFIHLAHLLANEHLDMVFKHLQDLFDPKDLINDFPHLFMVCSYVVQGVFLKV